MDLVACEQIYDILEDKVQHLIMNLWKIQKSMDEKFRGL